MHVISGLGVGGAEAMLVKVLSVLRHRHHHSVISLQAGGAMEERIRELGIPVRSLDVGGQGSHISALRALRNAVRSEKPDFVQGWMYHGNLAATIAAWGAGCGVGWNIRQTLYDIANEKRGTRWVIRANSMLSSLPDVLLYNSDVSRQQHQKLGFSSKRAQLLPNGFDTQKFAPETSVSARIRAGLGITETMPIVGHVARFHPMKDHAAFVAAGTKLLAENSRLSLVLLGRGVEWSNPCFSPLTAFKDRVHLLGEKKDTADFMKAFDVLVSSSAWGEGFPNVLGEAMATGVPCVATNIGDSPAIIGNAGVIVEPRDVSALAAGIKQLLSLTPNERLDLGKRARRRILERYSLSAIADEYAHIYERWGPGSDD